MNFKSHALMGILMAALVVLPATGGAAESEGPWAGKAALGYLATSGNSESNSLNAAFKLSYSMDSWQHTLSGQAVGNVSNNVTTAERYQAAFKTQYNFTDTDYLFGLVNWEKDRFGGYAKQISETVGYGRRLINTDTHVLNIEIGAGAKQSDLFDGTRETGFIGRAGADYTWNLSDSAQFTQLLAVESGSGNTYIESVTAISSTLLSDLALVASYTIKNNSDVPAGRDKTDTFTALSLEYTF